jgi:hypothetical protein
VGPSLCPVDMYVKSRVVQDSVSLAWEMSKGALPDDEFESLSRILPNTNDYSSTVNEAVNTLRQVFYKLTPNKNVTAGEFQKLIEVPYIRDVLGLRKADL